MESRSPEEQARVDLALHTVENRFAQDFAEMDTDRFVEQGVSIFRAANEGIPSVNEGADQALSLVLKSLIEREPPKPFMGGMTATAWRMYTGELLKRVAGVEVVDFREVPLDYSTVPLPPHLGGLSEEQYRERLTNEWHSLQSKQV